MRWAVQKYRQSRLAQSESGQAMVEFSMTITMTLLLLFGMIDFCRAIYTTSVLQWAAQQGARTAIISPTPPTATVRAAVEEKLMGLDFERVIMPEPAWSGNVVQVQVSYEFEFIFPLVSRIAGDSIELSASASMIAH